MNKTHGPICGFIHDAVNQRYSGYRMDPLFHSIGSGFVAIELTDTVSVRYVTCDMNAMNFFVFRNRD